MKKLILPVILATTNTAMAEYKVSTERVKAQPIVIKSFEAQPEAIGTNVENSLKAVEAYLNKNKIDIAGPPLVRTLDWGPNGGKFEAGFPVKKKVESKEKGIIATELPGGLVAKTLHIGAYEKSEEGYKAIKEWMAKNKKKEAGAPWEQFVNFSETKEDKLKTEIFFPIQEIFLNLNFGSINAVKVWNSLFCKSQPQCL